MQVVCATLTGVLGRNLHGANGDFAVVYVDEAAQVLLHTVHEDQADCLTHTPCSFCFPMALLIRAQHFPLRQQESPPCLSQSWLSEWIT